MDELSCCFSVETAHKEIWSKASEVVMKSQNVVAAAQAIWHGMQDYTKTLIITRNGNSKRMQFLASHTVEDVQRMEAVAQRVQDMETFILFGGRGGGSFSRWWACRCHQIPLKSTLKEGDKRFFVGDKAPKKLSTFRL